MLKSILKLISPKKHIAYMGWHRKHFGNLSAIKTYLVSIFKPRYDGDLIAELPIPNSASRVLIRQRYSDCKTYDWVFYGRSYDITYNNVGYVIDAGAHIGLASIFFALKYPDVQILAIEPNLANFNLLERNTRKYPNIHVLNAGLWSHQTKLIIENPEDEPWAYRVVENNSDQGIESISIEDAMSKLKTDYIDIIKLNIEGSEIEVFRSSSSWIDKVKVMVVKLHDRFRPGCKEALEEAVEGHGFQRLTEYCTYDCAVLTKAE